MHLEIHYSTSQQLRISVYEKQNNNKLKNGTKDAENTYRRKYQSNANKNVNQLSIE